MSEVFDLDALEAEGEPFRFRHNGQDFEMPADIDLTTVAVIDAGDFERAMERLLGEDVWKGIVESSNATGAKPFGVKKMMALLGAYAKHLGVGGLGGLSASTDS